MSTPLTLKYAQLSEVVPVDLSGGIADRRLNIDELRTI
jgi:hypothetical protein